MNESCISRGRELYHEIWRTVATRFYNTQKLSDWGRWEKMHDALISDDQSAIRYAQIMLSSLGDRYTRLLTETESAGSTDVKENGDQNGIGAIAPVEATRLKCNIGYIAIRSFSENNIVELTESSLRSISDCDGYIIDVSNNLGGSLGRAIECLGLFIESGPLSVMQFRDDSGVTTQETYLLDDVCLMRIIHPDGSEEMKPFNRRACLIANKPVALVIGPDSASSCETFIAAMLANRRNVRNGRKENGGRKHLCWSFGERTSGKGIMQATLDIMGGRAALRISIGTFKSPGGHWFGNAQSVRRGIRADYRVRGKPVNSCKAALRQLKKVLRRAAP